MGAGEPSGSVKFGVVETKLADELRLFRGPAFDAFPDIENDQPILPVAHVDQSINDLDVVKHPATHDRFASGGFH